MLYPVMIFIAVGSNLPHPKHGGPIDVCDAAVVAIGGAGCRVLNRSRWFRTAPVPASDQPDFINGVVSVETTMNPAALLDSLHRIEAQFDRIRSVPNAARTLDLDLIAYGETVMKSPNSPVLPHPRMTDRAFVLYPLRDVAPDWVHPDRLHSVSELIDRLPADQVCVPTDIHDVGQGV